MRLPARRRLLGWMVLAALPALAAPPLPAAETTPSQAASALGTAEVRQVVGPPQGSPLAGAELERRTAEVSDLLRCPVCQGLSIADSPSSLARQMKALVRAMLAAGYQEEQILEYFRYSYGDFVLLRPSMKGASATVWLAPVAGLLLGGAVIWWWMRRSNRASAAEPSGAPAPAAPAETPRAEAQATAAAAPPAGEDLEPYLERVRRLVGGAPAAEPDPRRNES